MTDKIKYHADKLSEKLMEAENDYLIKIDEMLSSDLLSIIMSAHFSSLCTIIRAIGSLDESGYLKEFAERLVNHIESSMKNFPEVESIDIAREMEKGKINDT